ncbi:MAG: hypothetical protein NWS72_01765, partial [Thermoleophilia bacterium]|nr:hypothetical protein [Thermoleophilia bacterium]
RVQGARQIADRALMGLCLRSKPIELGCPFIEGAYEGGIHLAASLHIRPEDAEVRPAREGVWPVPDRFPRGDASLSNRVPRIGDRCPNVLTAGGGFRLAHELGFKTRW